MLKLVLLILVSTTTFSQSLRLTLRVDRIPVVGHGAPEKSIETVTFKFPGDLLIIQTEQDTLVLKHDRTTFLGKFRIYLDNDNQEWWVDMVYEERDGMRIAVVPLKPYKNDSLRSLNFTYEKPVNPSIISDSSYTESSGKRVLRQEEHR